MYDIQLTNNAFEGANSVYLLGVEGDGPTTLVDTGVALPTIRDELAGHLREAGVEFADVERVVLTHWHHDHAGLASEIQAAGDATVYVHEADAPLVANEPGAMAAVEATQERYLEAWAMPEPKREELLAFLERHDDLRGGRVEVTTLSDGDHVRAGPYDLEVVHLPGHAAGLAAYTFEREGRREAFVGDAILPKYTPNVGGADVRVDRPLANYLASLERIQTLDLDRAWPGHRGPIIAPSARARDIAVHHEERTERVMDALRERGPATAWEVSDALFGHLETIHILHGPGEAYAHLDHLVHEGVVAETDGRYELVDDSRAASDVLAAGGRR
ncbi:MAG: MBL fold metallo-hydrolase [Halanaeroarchaeum sp.]